MGGQTHSFPIRPEDLVDRHGERIYRLARRLLRNESDAEDVTQNVLLKVLQRSSTYRGESDPMGWIYRITLNEARELWRRQARRKTVSLDVLEGRSGSGDVPPEPVSTAPRPEGEVLAAEVEEQVRAAVEELPDGYREAVVLLDLEGLTYKQAAEAMGLTLAGFKTRLHRARLHLRDRLEEFWRARGGTRPASGGGTGGRP